MTTLLFLSACGGYREDEIERIQFDQEAEIVVATAEDGGALGEVVYRLYYVENSYRVMFFQGANPRRFRLSIVDGGVHLDFCYGTVYDASPILTSRPAAALVPVLIDLGCS